jgi:glyoxylase-like metal-dependent hydrolase (beta-lactamase superfamily II)
MRELAPGLWQLAGLPFDLINQYLIATPAGDVLIDAGTRWDAGRILRALRGRTLAAVALTHVHPDHQGAAAEVCRRFHVGLACHQADADAMEGKEAMALPVALVRHGGGLLLAGAPYPVATRWQGGETVGEWRVIHTPGHTPGHVIFFRERDGVVLAGDLARNASLRRGSARLVEPPWFFSTDPNENRRSIRRLLELRPRLVCFGHGPEVRDWVVLERFVAGLKRA